ncbi:5'-methylthioadenosine/S-adenosylhomocysteine nucleosidase [Candidatus Moduliflexus flocculans]|uniref:adenosylhomocysteine nucleosidase n=1 Tax=Candidatus Moduliflexus flocculans TaxID=1499966 RepID=A0A0S6VYS7_9BACT|nr:5'-methylthioadenosine/S-adenosylhomocysteine nucleosidase [Candidatus Moduliflexus flocculans]
MPPEIAPFKQALTGLQPGSLGAFPCWRGTFQQRDVSLVLCGIGKVHAAAAAQLTVSELKPDAVFSCGSAGSLDDRLDIGDVVVGASTLQHDYGFVTPDAFIPFGLHLQRQGQAREYMRRFPADASLLSVANAIQHDAPPSSPRVVIGTILTGDQVIFSAEKRQALRQEFDALAVEMESAAIAQVCALYDIPFLSIRGISDHASEAIPLDTSRLDPNELAEFSSASLGKKLSLFAKTISYLAHHPSAFVMSVQARQHIKTASEHSAQITLRFIEQLGSEI